jgi:DNA-binding MarR family transcriptional regulator
MVTGTGPDTTALAGELFESLTRLRLLAQGRRRRAGDLTELEFLTLSLLHAQQPRVVGDLLRLLEVSPTQMSRILRALEGRERPLIRCHINPQDKRKVNVTLTLAGERALAEYRANCLTRLTERLRQLSEEEQEELLRLAHKLLDALEPAATE